MRLAKYLAHAGVASRRAAEKLIAAGSVSVDGEVVLDPARDVSDDHRVSVQGRELAGAERRVTYALHKPAGVVSTARDTHGRRTVIDLVADPRARLYPVGRLDADSSGLILLTNDGELANRLTHPSFEVHKAYRVLLGGAPVGDGVLRRLRDGVRLEDGLTAPARARRLGEHEIELTIHEGRNRQVRRMCAAVGQPVLALVRVRFGPLELGDLREGEHRVLSEHELGLLRAL
ncbi:MAG: pseudouridine synthase [Solirubrobacteraceae bacterium]